MNPLGLLLAASLMFGGDSSKKAKKKKAPPSKGWPTPSKAAAPKPAPKPAAPKPPPTPAAVKKAVTKLPSAAVTNALAKAIPALRALSKTQPQPWPQVPPANLPPFPGPGWTPDTPVRPEVAARAAQLIRPLHERGVGSHVIEQTGGRWIAYVARMHGLKKAVEAWRRTVEAAPVTRPAAPSPGAPAPRPPVPSPTPAVVRPSPVVSPAPSPSIVIPPTIRRGDGRIKGGMRQSMAPHVERAQRALNERMQSGEPLVVDGAFGGKTEAAVKQWQTHRGLQVDGIIGPETWPTLLT